MIRQNFNVAQDRNRKYENKNRVHMEFLTGDHVQLCVRPKIALSLGVVLREHWDIIGHFMF